MVFLMLVLLTSCASLKEISLDILPERPLREYIFVSCEDNGMKYACLDQQNASEYLDYSERIDIYIEMVESLREGEKE